MHGETERALDQRAQELFLETCELPVSRRQAFLDRACKGDPALRDRTEALLTADQAPADFSGAVKDRARSLSPRDASRLTPGQSLLQPGQVTANNRAHRSVEPGGHSALKFAQLRKHLAGTGHKPPVPQCVCNSLFLVRA